MSTFAWWAVHGVQVAVLVAGLAFALAPARRLGGHTLYGNLLFLMVLGFWGLLVGEAVFLGRKALDVWEGPGSFNDVPSLVGWLLLWLSILLFVERFSPAGRGKAWRWGQLAVFIALPTVGLLVLFRMWLSPPGADPDAWIRVPYLLIDAWTIGVIAGGLDRFRRLHKSALGRLYMFLGAAVVVKTMADCLWAYLAARDASSLVPTALYPIAGLLAVTGLGLHARAMRRESLPESPPSPWIVPEQEYLAALAARLQESAGGYAARTALMAAAAALERHGVPWRLEGWTLQAKATVKAWQQAMAAADEVAVGLLGSTGTDVVSSLHRPGAVA